MFCNVTNQSDSSVQIQIKECQFLGIGMAIITLAIEYCYYKNKTPELTNPTPNNIVVSTTLRNRIFLMTGVLQVSEYEKQEGTDNNGFQKDDQKLDPTKMKTN